MHYRIYRGVKKPLVLFGLKDRYIYHALVAAVLGLFLSVVLSSLLDFWGLLIGLGIAGALVSAIYRRQDRRGLYPKPREKNLLYMPKSRQNFLKLY